MAPILRVVVAREIDPATRAALTREGITHVSGHRTPGLVSSSLLVQAPDEAQAEESVRRALGEDVVIRQIQFTPVFVHALVTPDAREALERAAEQHDQIVFVAEFEDTGQLEVTFEFPGDVTLDGALAAARALYESIMEDGGLEMPESLEMRVTGFESLLFHTRRDRQLLDRAHELLDQNEPELAVILAQTACEILTADTLRTLLIPHASDALAPWLMGRVRSFTLKDHPTRDLWEQVTGSRVQDQEFWTAYRMHVDRRHGVVHRGEQVTAAAAEESLNAASAMFTYVQAIALSHPSQPLAADSEGREGPGPSSRRSPDSQSGTHSDIPKRRSPR